MSKPTAHAVLDVPLDKRQDEGHGGAVTLIQRFGSAAKFNIHIHYLVPDGVCPVRCR